MVTHTEQELEPRLPLTKQRVLKAAVALADEKGLEALSMRNLGETLGVQAMSLYNHVSSKGEILNGILDAIVDEIEAELRRIELTDPDPGWKEAIRRRALTARSVLMRHPWAPNLMTVHPTMSATILEYYDHILGDLIEGGFPIDLAHHAMHALGSSALGFTQELFESDDLGPEVAALFSEDGPTDRFRNLVVMAQHVRHDAESTLGGGCNDLVEFEFALDLMLDGLERKLEQA